MKKIFLFIMLILLVGLLAGCLNHKTSISDYRDDDVAAVVHGEKITIGDLRFLYADKDVLDNIKGTVKMVLVEQEAKKMGLDITDKINETFPSLPQKDADNKEETKSRDFFDRQAKKLGMKTKDYFHQYVKQTSKQSAYMTAYIGKKLGAPDSDDQQAMKTYNNKANQLLDTLVKENKNQLRIKSMRPFHLFHKKMQITRKRQNPAIFLIDRLKN